jgi:ribosomal protein L13E
MRVEEGEETKMQGNVNGRRAGRGFVLKKGEGGGVDVAAAAAAAGVAVETRRVFGASNNSRKLQNRFSVLIARQEFAAANESSRCRSRLASRESELID